MAFDGPLITDYDNVASLNLAYLRLIRRDEVLQKGLHEIPEPYRCRITALDQAEAERLAATPFLLFSFRETDDLYWNRILAAPAERDLFRSAVSESVDTVICAGLGFVWQLAQRNPYALRLTCGATLYWCERIAELTFYRLIDAVRCSGEVPILRVGHQHELWRKLLGYGVSRMETVRRAAQMSALQAVLTGPPDRRRERWSLAARNVRAPGLEVAEENDPQR